MSLRIGNWVRRFGLVDAAAHFADNLRMLLSARPRVDFRFFLEEEVQNPADEGTYNDMRLATVNGRLLVGSAWNPDFLKCRPYLGHALHVPTFPKEEEKEKKKDSSSKSPEKLSENALHHRKSVQALGKFE